MLPHGENGVVCEPLGLRLHPGRPFHEVMHGLLQQRDDEFLGKFMTLLYVLWCTRNELVFNDTQATVEQVLKRVSTLLPPSDLQPVMQRSSRSLPPVWSRPAVGVFKVNLDAALQQNGEAGGGLIARDSYGEVIAAACRLLGPVLAPSIAEALALRWLMLMAKDLGVRRVAFETDCLVLFDV